MWLIVINEIRQEAIWLTLINEIFKFPPHFDPFGYENYLDELFLG